MKRKFFRSIKLNNITQPAVSKRVKEINRTLCNIFLRRKKKIELTRKGKEIYHFANQTLFAYNDLLDNLTSDFEQTIVLGSGYSLSQDLSVNDSTKSS